MAFVLFDEEHLNKLFREDPQQTTRELAEQMDCHHSTVLEQLHSIGKVRKLGAWVPNVLNQKTKIQRCTIAAGLLARHRLTHGHVIVAPSVLLILSQLDLIWAYS